jgi:oleate hydratase
MTKAYLVGGGIASLAAAVYLLRDGAMPGSNITIFEESRDVGGSLDGRGSAEAGYVIRGGRMFNLEAYTCTYDLLSSVPSLGDAGRTVRDEIRDFNARIKTHSRCRLVERRQKIDASALGLRNRDRLDLLATLVRPEATLEGLEIRDCFAPSFFESNFWLMWCSMFAFQPWHSAAELKRYLHRFLHEFSRLHTLGGVDRTPYNQYDSIVAPLLKLLRERGVRFASGVRVTDFDFKWTRLGKTVERLRTLVDGRPGVVEVADNDHVIVTLGSMTSGSRLGSMTAPAALADKHADGAWALWEALAQHGPEFGRPAAFADHIEQSKWLSFTVTFRDPTFFQRMQAFTGNEAGTGGLVTFADSNWLLSVVLAHQPHFLDQPPGVNVCWGYGLFPDDVGDYVAKKMADCTGEDLLTELCLHLGFERELPRVLATSTCIPCMMPFITSQFLPRRKGDRPAVRPKGTTNLALVGQFCELPDDVVFTVEYSVRSAQTAVYALLDLDREPAPLYKGQHDPKVLYTAAKTLLR